MIGTIRQNQIISDFLSGMAHVLDLGSTLEEYPEPLMDDAEAIASDWKTIGDDMKMIFGKYNE